MTRSIESESQDTLQDNRMPQLSDPELEKAEKFTTDASPPSSFPAEEIDPRNPKIWPRWKKLMNFCTIFGNTFLGYFTSAVYVPATVDLRHFFDTSLTVINATIALFIFVVGLAPLIWAPLSERIGRKYIYVSSAALYVIFTIICGISNNLGLFFAMRLLQGIAASAGMAVGGGTVVDLFEPHERGRYMSFFMASLILGPAVGPIAGGFIDQYLSWRWIFYISAMVGGAVLLADIFLLSETLYRRNNEINATSTSEKFKQFLQRVKFNPFTVLNLLLRPEVALVCFAQSVIFGWFYMLVTVLTPTYVERFNFPTGYIGLLFIAAAIGNLSGSVVAGFVSDSVYARQRRKNNGVAKTEARLLPVYIGIPFLVAGMLLYGWLLYANVHWFAPLPGLLLFCLGAMYSITTSTTYIVEAHLKRSASVVSVANFCRNLFAMIFSLISLNIRQGLGDGWSYTLAALTILVITLACFLFVQKFGERLRESYQQRQQQQQQQQ
ncbi:hypothetical protein VTP01DRAFT_3024 [Rhizomucor pusillus]|uniref:uncharacterized protein n=1 Tax=Rhizomucor pusillus TaxID=4840 RepID=UPI0037446DB6